MKSLAKFLLVGAVAVMAVAVTAVPSEAAKKKKGAAAALCTPGWTCSMGSKVMACGGDGKWYPALFTPVCIQPFCPPACR